MNSSVRNKKPSGKRERRGALFLSVVLILTAISCAKASKPREVAERFMDLYYARMNVAEAIKLCSGAARTRLEGELRTIKGLKPDKPAGEPRVSYSLTASSTPTSTQAVYTYKVTAQTSDVGIVVATLTLAEEGGLWTVTLLSEQEGPPKS